MTHPTALSPCSGRPEQDAIADQITIGVLIEAFDRYGITPLAFKIALHAVTHTDAFETGNET